jgi:RNA-splicing ligase RtcB/intein/homing endonuclease
MKFIDGIPIWGDPVDEGALKQIKNCARSADKAALMADHHLGYAVPIGGVVAYEDRISPSGVGFDIACGNKAVLTNIPAREVRAHIKTIMDDIWAGLSFGVGRKNSTRVDHALFDDPAWKLHAVAPLKQMAREQLGTIGSGNHYIDLFEDERGRVWIGVHFGSRGLGHKTATYFLKAGGAKDGIDVDPLVLSVKSDLGADYLACMQLAGRYAYAGRDWVCAEVARILGADILEEVHNHHNFCIPGDQKIPTPKGYKFMRDIMAGDAVYCYQKDIGLNVTTVAKSWYSGKKQTVEIRTKNRKIRASEDHPILTIRVTNQPHPERSWHSKSTNSFHWVRAGDIGVGDLILCVSGYYEKNPIVGLEKARLIGAFLGDGWIRQNNIQVSGYGVGLAIGSSTDQHTARYMELCQSVLPQANWSNNAPGAFGLTCSSKTVHSELIAMGLGEKSATRRVPNYAFSMSIPEKLALLAGYFDSDGSVSNKNTSNSGRGIVASVSRELVEGLRELSIGCGLQVTPVNIETRKTNYNDCTVYRFALSADSIALLELWHTGKAANQRKTKYQKLQGLQTSKIGYMDLPNDTFVQSVVSIKPVGIEDVYDMEVLDDSHTFICEGIVVHNCWREDHDGQALWVVRKGATPAFPGQRGFVGGSMGDISVILEGVESQDAKHSLYSTVHGAGRVMSRTAARGKTNRKTGEVISPGAVSRKMMLDWIRKQNVELRGAGTDESPHCYKRLPEVLTQQGATIRIVHTLKPLGVAMAGEHEFDPYKD